MTNFRIDDEEGARQFIAGARWGGVGVELGHLDTGGFTGRFVSTNISGLVLDYSSEVDGWFAGANGRVSLGESPWHVDGRIGALRWSMAYAIVINRPVPSQRFDVDDTGLYAGAGIGRNFGSHASAGIALDYFRLDHRGDVFLDASMRMLSLALEYRF
ncbi:MAG TPA: hypothetical protein VND91_05550 [Candidatus Saccharimonadia bacterium]|nr:hypothetical protein [Candidatus Saccharimonadia bacterium]